MEFSSFEMAVGTIVVIVTWFGYMVLSKWNRRFSYIVESSEPISKDNKGLVDASASLPSSAAPQRKYDVFLSFRGIDTRQGITYELYDRLQNRRGVKTFMDDQDLQVGDAISPTLLAAIEDSRFAIIVVSQNYASSTWCLEELTKICQYMEDNNRILPLFYRVDPTDVRHQKGSFGDAFAKHERSGRHREKVQEWRDALKKVANFSGWHMQNYKTERQLIDTIVEFVCSKVRYIEIRTEDFEAFEATRQSMDKVIKALKDKESIAVGVYGMGGVGKTTMVKHVGAQACRNEIFDHCIMAVVSQSPDLRKIQGALADLLGFKFKEESEIGRAARLSKEIMRREKILIILDDVWNNIELSDIGIPSYKELQNCNSKVLLTTRRQNVCHAMKCQEKITLEVLSVEDSWTLFVKNARRSFDTTNFDDVARKVAGECRGLPIALIAVARALGDKDLAEWKKACRRLEKSQTANLDDEAGAFKCIKLSYDYLKNEDSKSCFLLCCLFPEDYDIEIENLFKYAIGKGLFRGDDTIQEARETADLVVKHLKDSSLLLDSEKNGCVKMHDVIRDTAMNIAKFEDGHGFLVKVGSGLKHWSCPLHESYSAISLMKNKLQRLPEELVCPNLQILLLQENADLDKITETFFQSPNELRVLDLSNTSILLLPQSFSLLTNLQALYLDFCHNIIDFSILGKLKKLEILSMEGYPLEKLSRELGHLTNLRMLDVSGTHSVEAPEIVRIPSNVISKLHRLEELYMVYCGFWDWGSKVEGEGEETNIGFDELTTLSNLQILQVCISDAKCIPKNVEVEPNWVYFNIRIGRYTYSKYSRPNHNSRSLELVNTTIITLPDWFVNVVTTKTEELMYNSCKGLSNILMEYDRGRLHGLKHLKLYRCSFGSKENLKELMNTTTRVKKEPVFENLEELQLICLDCLKEVCVGELPLGSLFNLKFLRVYHCPNLGNVSKLLHRLANLEKLSFNHILNMEYVFRCEEFEPKPSKLRVMNLVDLRALKSICNCPAPRAMFQTLKSLAILHCNILQSVFTSDVAHCLFQLEDLFVEQCPLLESVIEASKEIENNKKMVLPKLKNLVLNKLPMLYRGSATVDIECPSLEHLYVEECPQFSFSTFASSDYFSSRNQVQLNDPQRIRYDFLVRRLWSSKLES